MATKKKSKRTPNPATATTTRRPAARHPREQSGDPKWSRAAEAGFKRIDEEASKNGTPYYPLGPPVLDE